MKTKMIMLALIVASSTAFVGCKKEEGCTDSSAMNYDSDAEEDDGSCVYTGCTDLDAINYDADATIDDGDCQYEGKMVFWYDQATSATLIADGAISLTIRVDNTVVGSYATSVYFTGAPSCGQNSTVSVTRNLGGNKSETVTYSVKDQTGWEYWSGNVTFVANSCKQQQLVP